MSVCSDGLRDSLDSMTHMAWLSATGRAIVRACARCVCGDGCRSVVCPCCLAASPVMVVALLCVCVVSRLSPLGGFCARRLAWICQPRNRRRPEEWNSQSLAVPPVDPKPDTDLARVAAWLACKDCVSDPCATVAHAGSRAAREWPDALADPPSAKVAESFGRARTHPNRHTANAVAAQARPRADLNRDRWIQSPEC